MNNETPLTNSENEGETLHLPDEQASLPSGVLQEGKDEFLPDGQTGRTTSRVTEQTEPIRTNSSHASEEYALPKKVNVIDMAATHVTPAAFRSSQQVSPEKIVSRKKNITQSKIESSARGKKEKTEWKSCLVSGAIGMVFAGLFIIFGLLSFFVLQYFTIAAGLPTVGNLQEKASQFETTRILDRNGNLLYEIMDPHAGRRTFIPLEKISPYFIAATLATEDKDFFNHPGFNPLAILRALIQNYTSGGVVSGASTITQQLARNLLLSPEERSQQTVHRKAREIVLAAEITRKYSKEKILELYLNENYYGNLAYGVEAAAETYFDSTADKLSLSQSAFLAGLPQAPGVYDIFTNREATLQRNRQVLRLLVQVSKDRGCIATGGTSKPVCIEDQEETRITQEIEQYSFRPPQYKMNFPHWVNYIRGLMEEQYDPQTIYRSGFTVYTTLDPNLQKTAEQIVATQVAAQADKKMTDGALVAIQPSTGEILAMVGSADFYNAAISGQVNMAVSPRQPGSSIKPLTYTAAFEKGWTPATLIWDVPSEFPPSGDPKDPHPPYKPVNYDGRFHGPVTVRTALANSYNMPAVKTLNFIGIYSDPGNKVQGGFINFAKRMGITTLTRDDYGLSLTLGGGEVSLLQLTSAFGIFANGGVRQPSVAITRIVDYAGNVIFTQKNQPGVQVIRPEHAYLIDSILSDDIARSPMFGTNSVLNLPFPVAAKTGTTNDFRDNWTLGFTPDLAVGVWVGNADFTPMENTTGVTGAAPIWAEFMKTAIDRLTGGNPAHFVRPPGIVEKVICSISGAEPSDWCTKQRTEIFAVDQPPEPKERDLLARVRIDTWTGLKASTYCSDTIGKEDVLNVNDPWAIKWIINSDQGRAWAKNLGLSDIKSFAPPRECNSKDPRPVMNFVGIQENQEITSSPLDIYAIVNATHNFKDFNLEFGLGDNPGEWYTLVNHDHRERAQPDRIFTWDLNKVPSGKVTLRILMDSTEDTQAEKRLHLNLNAPKPTATATLEPTSTLTPTETPVFTETSTISETPTTSSTP